MSCTAICISIQHFRTLAQLPHLASVSSSPPNDLSPAYPPHLFAHPPQAPLTMNGMGRKRSPTCPSLPLSHTHISWHTLLHHTFHYSPHQVDGLDVVACNGVHVRLVVADGEDAAMHRRVQRLHTPCNSQQVWGWGGSVFRSSRTGSLMFSFAV